MINETTYADKLNGNLNTNTTTLLSKDINTLLKPQLITELNKSNLITTDTAAESKKRLS